MGWYSHAGQFARHGPQRDLCRLCYEPGVRTFQELGVRIHRYSDYLTAEERTQSARWASTVPLSAIAAYRLNGLAVGDHALAGALRFYGCATIEHEPHSEAVLRRYFHAALLTVFATRRLLATHTFRTAVFHHGLYVPHGLVGEVCRERGVPAVNWGATYRQQCFLFSHDDTYHHTLMSESPAAWEELDWTAAMETGTCQRV
jgi:hypothetical protein